MALIEVEMITARFNQFVQFLTSTGPIPIGVLNGLGPTRLIAEFTWNQVTVGPAPPGFNVAVGTLTASCSVTIRHVSTADLDADQNATGLTTPATAFIRISPSPTNLSVDLLAIEVAGAPLQSFMPPAFVARQAVPTLGGATIAGAALLLRDDIVTLRFATRAADSLEATPVNLLVTTSGDHWAIRLSGEFFTEQLLQALQGALATPPPDTTIEDAPSASWGISDGSWASVGKVGLEKKNACPSLLGKVDLSITVDVVLTPSANITGPPPLPPQLNLRLLLSSDVSDWDTFRCWVGSGGIGSAILGYIATPIVGPATGGLGFLAGVIVSLIAVAETVRLDAGKEVTGTNVPNFTPVSNSSTTATYTSRMNLPSLVTTAGSVSNGLISAATTGPFGMLISGNIQYWMAKHNVTFVPNGGTLTSGLQNSYNCDQEAWQREAKIQEVTIQDQATLFGTNLNRVLVTVFPSSLATPPHLWSLEQTSPEIDQMVRVFGSDSVNQGDTGKIYLHTSAGIRRFDIPPLPNVNPPTQQQIIEAVARCARQSKMFRALDELQWLIDPPPYDFGFPPLRQWLFTFGELRAGTRIVVNHILDGVRSDRSVSFVAEKSGDASFELITNAGTELVFEHNQEVISDGRLLQRWIIPTQIIDTGEIGRSLTRSGSLIAVIQQGGIFTHDLSTGSSLRHIGELRLTKLAFGGLEVIEQTRRRLDHGVTDLRVSRSQSERIIDKAQRDASPFSLTLRGGKVAALFESKLVIGIPWQAGRVILS